MKKRILQLAIIICLPTLSFGQLNFQTLLNSGLEDINTLGEAYLNPYGKGFGTAMNAGWNNTAKPHKLFGFDLTINTTLVTIPTADNTFDMKDYNWNNITYDQNNSVTSTVSGDAEGIPVGLRVEDGTTELEINNLYNLPTGVNFNKVPLPMMQFGIGLPKGTELQARLFPTFEVGDFGKIGMLGFGLKHDIKQWIPVVNKLPFDMSIHGAWSKLTASFTAIEYFPTNYISTSTFDYIDPAIAGLSEAQKQNEYYDSQELVLKTSAWNVNLLVSKKLLFVTLYGSIGYSSSNFNVALNGDYLIPEYEVANGNDTNGDFIYTSLTPNSKRSDPVDFSIPHSSLNTSIGLRIKLAVLSLHGAFIYQDYAMVNAGIGISFR